MKDEKGSRSIVDPISLDADCDAFDLPKQEVNTAEEYLRNLHGLFLILFLYWYSPIHNQSQSHINFLLIPYPLLCRVHHVFVTAYWQGPSKHLISQYTLWIRRFLSIFVGQIYFYTTPLTWQLLSNGTTLGVNVHKRFNYTDPYQIPCMSSLRTAYAAQWLIDPEKRIHNPRLYAVWNGKLCLVSEISLTNPFASVFWIDAGSCRERQYDKIQFPNSERIKSILLPATKGAMIFAMWRLFRFRRPSVFRFFRENYVMAGFFGGDQAALMEYSLGFWAIHDYYLKHDHFIGKEQNIMSTYLVYTDQAWVQPNYQGRCNSWFATFSFYSNTTICFQGSPKLLPSREYFDNWSNWSFSLHVWRKLITVPHHSFGL
jgi:hypothetical protein